MEISPPTMIFRQGLVGPWLATWNTLLGRLAMVQLTQGNLEFFTNLHENGKFSVDTMHIALVHSEVQVNNNNKDKEYEGVA
jgi:predicted phosphodiesterase